MFGIGVDDGDAALAHKFREQPQLGGEVVGKVGVIVEMVAGEIGEAGRGDRDTVETVLIEAVAGGFERQMVDAAPFSIGPDRL